MGSQMDSESVKKLASELDISGCGSVNLEVHLMSLPYMAPRIILRLQLLLGFSREHLFWVCHIRT